MRFLIGLDTQESAIAFSLESRLSPSMERDLGTTNIQRNTSFRPPNQRIELSSLHLANGTLCDRGTTLPRRICVGVKGSRSLIVAPFAKSPASRPRTTGPTIRIYAFTSRNPTSRMTISAAVFADPIRRTFSHSPEELGYPTTTRGLEPS